MPKLIRFLVMAALVTSAADVYPQSVASITVSPPAPLAGTPVYATYNTQEPCFNQVDLPATQITLEQNVVNIKLRLRADYLDIGCNNAVRHVFELGQFPAGNYRVAAFFESLPNPPYTVPATATRAETSFVVAPVVGANRPLNNVSGVWYSLEEDPGWSLSIYQIADRRLLASWQTYDVMGNPTWFFFLPGQWTSTNIYEAPIAKATAGPYFGRPVAFNSPPTLPSVETVGSARLIFGASAPIEGGGTFTYTVAGATFVRSIRKFEY